jgi:Family of unknown function (DUF5670)
LGILLIIVGNVLAKIEPRTGDSTMLLVLFIILLIAWILGWAVFHVAGALIHFC